MLAVGTLRASVGARGARRSVARQSEERIHPLSVAGGKERASDVLVGVVSRHLSVSRTPARSSAYSGRVSTMPYPFGMALHLSRAVISQEGDHVVRPPPAGDAM